MEAQARRFAPAAVAMANHSAARDLRARLADTPIRVLAGPEGVCELAADQTAGIVVAAVTGLEGLAPTLAALEGGRRVALAGKESLVCAGELVMRRAKERNSAIIPVDSEHSAIFQCIQANCAVGDSASDVDRIVLTASGGPFFGFSRDQLRTATPALSMNHPTWRMGGKITLDSATLVNKGLECIEATHLFGLPIERIDVVIHRQSVIHSMVVFRDGSTVAQLGVPDMRLPIQYALTWPERLPSPVAAPDWARMNDLTFAPPDEDVFPAVSLAREAAARGGTAPAVYNGAAEEASLLFLQGRIGFLAIAERVARALRTLPAGPLRTLEDVFEADRAAREIVRGSESGI
jgi:1-deoxy-D-xylulose-5-phosphate reductoisomerase